MKIIQLVFLMSLVAFSTLGIARDIKDLSVEDPAQWKVGDKIQGLGTIKKLVLTSAIAIIDIEGEDARVTLEIDRKQIKAPQ